MKKFYKTNCKSVLKALSEMNSKKDELVTESNKVAAHFNAKSMTSTSTTGVRFGGLALNNYHEDLFGKNVQIREDKILWTTPDSNGISRPRASLTKAHFKHLIKDMCDVEAKKLMKQKRSELKALQEEYRNMVRNLPDVEFEKFFESIGTSWGELMFCGLNWFEFDGYVYLCSGADLSSKASEILGSEFEKAKSESK